MRHERPLETTALLLHRLTFELGWTNEQIADYCGLSVRTIQRWWAGSIPHPKHYYRLASCYESHLKKSAAIANAIAFCPELLDARMGAHDAHQPNCDGSHDCEGCAAIRAMP